MHTGAPPDDLDSLFAPDPDAAPSADLPSAEAAVIAAAPADPLDLSWDADPAGEAASPAFDDLCFDDLETTGTRKHEPPAQIESAAAGQPSTVDTQAASAAPAQDGQRQRRPFPRRCASSSTC